MTNIVTLTLNPALDLSTSIDRLIPGHKLRCGELRRDPGGGGVNVARVISRLGGDVTAVFPAGGPSGAMLQHLLRHEKVASHVVLTRQDTRENLHVFEKETKQQYRFVMPGPSLSESAWRRCRDAVIRGSPPRYIVCSGSLPPGAPENAYARLAKHGKRTGAQLVVDSSGPALRAALDEGVYFVKQSLRELRQLTGQKLNTEASWIEVCQKLVAADAARIIALTLGDRGALLVTREITLRAEAPPIHEATTIGAGDSFLAALVWSLAKSLSITEALRMAVAAGSSALLGPGTGLCLRKDIERLMAQVRIEER
ncbi:1-phosphofructokinase family hexose kinase [Methylocapsa aurea]|uniref:1-phosphofructokinase family hexose kinase n=1 Tax=Methylocapsa aurea TaxID=663610 RepID=UPI00055E027C|nr:1-phosphofructokinase family hexose kinase [Methylocapsa aurea]